MSRLPIKRGFTLLEVLCSLGIFSIIFLSIFSYEVTSLKLKKDIKNNNNDVIIMEAVKNNIIYSMTFEDLEQLQVDNKIFINSENMTLDKIKSQVVDVFSGEANYSFPYIQLNFLKFESKVYTLSLSLHAGIPENNIKLQCNFYKGCHK